MHVGVYENKKLILTCKKQGMTSLVLPDTINTLLKEFTCKGLYYVKGPGSFMSIKASYIFLRTISIALDVPFLACDGFEVNANSPIQAYAKMYFVKKNDTILTKMIENVQDMQINLPLYLSDIDFDEHNEPLYILPAV